MNLQQHIFIDLKSLETFCDILEYIGSPQISLLYREVGVNSHLS